ncbi:hypothetical protein [Candidatus Ichthyocystis sparus]|uniref:hypothetical protein n=1 Tax=Candidatus Ichthyocystis sparus TaxID=1561004 RepID=UPI000B831C58|nr:hypothetical protein [Candidatus Ichthyocystis sparus]
MAKCADSNPPTTLTTVDPFEGNEYNDLRLMSESALSRASQVSEKASSFFTETMEHWDPDTFTANLQTATDDDVEGISHLPGFKVTPEGDVEYKSPMTSSAKALIFVGVLLALLLVAFLIFAILAYTGHIHIPGLDATMLCNIEKWAGVALCGFSVAYLLFASGFAAGQKSGRSDSESKAEALTSMKRCNLRKTASDQAKIMKKLVKAHTKVQVEVSTLATAAVNFSIMNKSDAIENAKSARESQEIKAHIDRLEAENKALKSRLTGAGKQLQDLLSSAGTKTKEELVGNLNDVRL